jgi:hypothetical protein
MEISFNPKHYTHVPMFFWPWVMIQLFLLRRWAQAEDRQIVFEIDVHGKVHVLLMSDDKSDLRAWLNAQRTVYRDHWIPMHNDSGEAHLCAYHYWMGRLMECGRRIHDKSNRAGEYPAPAIDNSS